MIPFEVLPTFTVVLVQFVLAGLLLFLGTAHRANWALALVLVARGAGKLADGMFLVTDDPALKVAWAMFHADAYLLYYPALAYFLLVFPRPRTRLVEGWHGAAALAAVAGGLVGAKLLWPALYVNQGVPGPLSLLLVAGALFFPLAALVLFRDALRMPQGGLRSSVLLVSAALALIQLYDTVMELGGLATADAATRSSPLFVPLLSLHLAVASLFVVLGARLAHALNVQDVALRSATRRYLLALTAPAAAAAVALTTVPDSPLRFVLEGAWDLALPLLVTYALFRYQLLDIDLKVKWGIRQSTIAGTFVAVFFVASEAAQEFLGETLGSAYVGIATTGAFVFALAPLQRFAERVSSAALPDVRDTDEYRTVRKHEVYRAALESAVEDGTITEKERAVLATLQDQLGLSARDALALEQDVVARAR